MADDLSDPLGQGKKHKRSRLPTLLPVGIAGVLGLCLAVFVVWAAVVDDPYGGEPVVVLSTDARALPAKKPDEVKKTASSTEIKGESSLRGHLKAEGEEQSGSQSYVPPETKDDKALQMAFDLLRGTKTNAAFPPSTKVAVPN